MFSFSKDIGIDLGTANTLVCLKGKGIILREPSVVAVDMRTDEVLAVGSQAKEMIGRTPGSIVAVRPLKDGVIADFKITAKMLQHFIKKAVKPGIFSKPRVIICMPSGVTEVERKAVEDAAYQAGAKPPVVLIEEPMAAAIGAGMPVDEPCGSMVVDIGGGTSEVAVISLGDIVTIGSAYPGEEEKNLVVKGRNLVDGLPKDITIFSAEVREALADPLATIVEAIRTTLEKTPPELSADIIDHGIMLTGGGALLKGLDMLVMQQTGMPVHIAERPLDCVVDGAGKRLGKPLGVQYKHDR